MSFATIRLTQFNVQRLQCIGSQGRVAPFHITTYQGMELGSFGEVMETMTEASNAAKFEKTGLEGLKRLLAVFTR